MTKKEKIDPTVENADDKWMAIKYHAIHVQITMPQITIRKSHWELVTKTTAVMDLWGIMAILMFGQNVQLDFFVKHTYLRNGSFV